MSYRENEKFNDAMPFGDKFTIKQNIVVNIEEMDLLSLSLYVVLMGVVFGLSWQGASYVVDILSP